MRYAEFVASKIATAEPVGFDPTMPINNKAFGFQRAIIEWSLRRGRAAEFADCGLGKSLCELEWGWHVLHKTNKAVLMLTPLAVAKQMSREAEKFGIEAVNVCRTPADVRPKMINVLNYERLGGLTPDQFSGIILDESSVLKAFEGATRKLITEFAKSIPYRLAASATPAPNDLVELTNHSEFLDVLTGKEMIAQFFTQDGNTTQKYRLKKHAVTPFWKWLASWSVAIRKPSDLGFDDAGFVLPELRIHEHIVESSAPRGMLFATDSQSLQERRESRRASLPQRCDKAAELQAGLPDESWLFWVDLNAEADALRERMPHAVEVRGSDPVELKEERFEAFASGEIKTLLTKSSIAGFGLNWQHCANMAFVGLSDSYEQQYQAIRRCYRFGQTRPVNAHFVYSEAEGAVVENVRRKERQAAEMFDEIVSHMAGFSIGQQRRNHVDYLPTVPMSLPNWMEMVG